MSIKIGKKDVIWSYLGYFFNLCTNLLLMPFILRYVDGNELGLWYTFLSVGLLVNLLDFGFSPTLVRNVTYAWCGAKEIKKVGTSDITHNTPNYKLFFSVLQACKYVSLIIAGLALVCLLTIGSSYIIYIARDIPKEVYGPAWIFYSIAVFLNIFYNYWTTTLKGVGAIKESQIAIISSKVAQIVISLFGLFLGQGITALSIAYLISGFVLRILSRKFLFRYKDIKKEQKKSNGKLEVLEFKSIMSKIWYNAKKTGLVSLCGFIITQGNTLICSAFIGLEETASYGLCLQLMTVIAGVAQTYFNANQPMMISTKVSGNKEKSIQELSLGMVIFWIIFIIGVIVLATIGIPLVTLIKSNTPLPVTMVLFMGFYKFLETDHSMFASYITYSNDVPYVPSSLVSACCILVGGFLVVSFTDFGIYGLMAVTALVEVAYAGWRWPLYVLKDLNVSLRSMIKIGFGELIKYIKSLK
ncbi:Membrane protein involved in the export of O-antigen and teichoic acid [Eubacterium maltosivorans]|uniref:O-unit flippase-like protein n=1 Tax=Eubacterium maltosivorans TaxID=2041044 RepID=UPI00088428E3|nr:O-unit flippase-like protein [Eubacterium maltosivorans]WPK80057.1 hypothetical protein EUMA32_14670 [Eubacterium maltosivorans]SDP87477.1 Membrane protein involved in the export of O-antigen and teichoic acid [Eubacterium maltosivorans]